jgi:hypothetical protein
MQTCLSDQGGSTSGRQEEIITRASEAMNIPEEAIAVQWGLLSNEIGGGNLGDRLLTEYQLGPSTASSLMELAGRAPELYGRAVLMVRPRIHFNSL